VSGLFFEQRRNGTTADTDRSSDGALREAFKLQFLDEGALLLSLLVFRVECAVEVAGFTVNLLLATGSMAILAQLSRAAAPAPDRNHAASTHPVHPAACYHTSVRAGPLPFFIRLRERVERDFPAPEEFPALVAKTITGAMPIGWVHRQLDSGRALVLIDGVDELPRTKRDDLLQVLNQLVMAYPLARYVITSRPSALKQDDWPTWSEWTNAESFTNATLQPMTSEQINSLIQQWHDALVEKLTDPDEIEEILQLPTTLGRTLRLRPSLRRLTTNPLLCSMICALHRESRENLPNERLKLYEQCVEMLLSKRDEGRKIVLSSEYARLTPGQQLALVQNFAYWMMRNSYSDVSVDEADDLFEERLPTIGANSEVDGTKVRRYFVERTNLIREPVDGRIDFTHRTFQEFLAAQQAVKENDLGLLREKATDDQWRELIILAAGIARPREAAVFLKKLVERGQKLKRSRLRHHVLLLAFACLETCVELDPTVRDYVVQQTRSIFPPKDLDEARLVAAAGDPAIPLLRYNPTFSPLESAACIGALANIGTAAAMQTIAEYATHLHPRIQLAIINAWDFFDKTEYARQVLSKVDSVVVPFLASWEGFSHLQHLKALAITDLSTSASLVELQQLSKLETLSIGNIISDKHFNIFIAARSTIRSSATQNNTNSESDDEKDKRVLDISPISGMSQLIQLHLSHNDIADLSPLNNLFNLQQLYISAPETQNLSFLENLINLKELIIRDVITNDISPLSHLTNLSELVLIKVPVKSLSPLVSLQNLKSLTLFNVPVDDLSPVSNLAELESLTIGNSPFSDMSTLRLLKRLTKLTLHDMKIPDLSVLVDCIKLTELQIQNISTDNISAIGMIESLSELNISGVKTFDLTLLARLKNLVKLTININDITDLSPIASLNNLTQINIKTTGQIDDSALIIMPKLKRLTINGKTQELSSSAEA
jgi:hypothetical protein